jgi:hypothetical protein
MRRKKVLVVVTALIACLAIGSATVATAKPKKKKVTTTITLSIQVTPPSPYYPPYDPYGKATFSGKVSAKGPSGCRKNRTVTISRGGPIVGQVTTNSDGSYSLTIQTAPPPGTYTASVEKKVVKKGKKKKKKFICSAATSPPVVVS